VLAEALGEDGSSDGWRVETGHYGRRHRCVLRYQRDAGPGSRPTVVYGKLCWDRSGAELVDGFADLQAAMAGIGVRLPSLLGYRPELGLSLLAELPGTPLLDGLRRRRKLGAAADAAGARLAGEVAAAGRVAAALHHFPARWGRARPFATEVAGLQDELTAMADISPQLAARLEAHLAAVSDAAAERHHPATTVQAHGDFTFSQLLDDGGRIGLLDFDGLCQAEPGLDLGQFLAYLRLTAAKAGTDGALLARGLEPRFLSAYADGRDDPGDRIEAYTALSLLRITVHAWQKLKPARARLALSTLEESELCH
jgi:aminoglycoside/choline kinase family phosphotransferase